MNKLILIVLLTLSNLCVSQNPIEIKLSFASDYRTVSFNHVKNSEFSDAFISHLNNNYLDAWGNEIGVDFLKPVNSKLQLLSGIHFSQYGLRYSDRKPLKAGGFNYKEFHSGFVLPLGGRYVLKEKEGNELYLGVLARVSGFMFFREKFPVETQEYYSIPNEENNVMEAGSEVSWYLGLKASLGYDFKMNSLNLGTEVFYSYQQSVNSNIGISNHLVGLGLSYYF